jgi:hypothetical protein
MAKKSLLSVLTNVFKGCEPSLILFNIWWDLQMRCGIWTVMYEKDEMHICHFWRKEMAAIMYQVV